MTSAARTMAYRRAVQHEPRGRKWKGGRVPSRVPWFMVESLRSRRIRLGMSQEALAEHVPCHPATIAGAERRAHNYSPEMVEAIDRVLLRHERALFEELSAYLDHRENGGAVDG